MPADGAAAALRMGEVHAPKASERGSRSVSGRTCAPNTRLARLCRRDSVTRLRCRVRD